MKEKRGLLVKGTLVLLVMLVAFVSVTMHFLVKTEAQQSDSVQTETFTIAALPDGVEPLETVNNISNVFTAATPSVKEYKAIEQIQIEGETAPGMYIDNWNMYLSNNYLQVENPIEESALRYAENVTLKIYVHFSSNPDDFYANGTDRGVWLYGADADGKGRGVMIFPRSFPQDQWADFTLTAEQFDLLCDEDGVFRGLKLGALVRTDGGDNMFYQDGSAFLAVESISYTVREEAAASSAVELPDGVEPLETVNNITNVYTAGSLKEYKEIAPIQIGAETAPGMYMHNYNVNLSSNAILLNEEVEDAVNSVRSVTLRLYVHFSTADTFYTNSRDRGVWLYGLDDDGKSQGVMLPNNIMQDRWTDMTLTAEQLAVLCDEDGVFRGLKLGSLLRTTEGDHMFYQDGSAFLAVGNIVVNEKAQQEPLVIQPVSDAQYGDTVTLVTTGGSGSGSVAYTVLSGPAEINGSRITFNGIGEVKVQASKAFDDDYKQAESEVLTINVAKFDANAVEWSQKPQDMPYSGEAVACAGEALRGEVSFTFYSYNVQTEEWTPIDAAPSARGRYKVVATVAETENYSGVEETVEFYITASVTTEGVTYTGSTRMGGTLTFAAESVPVGQEVDHFEVKVGNGEYRAIEGNTYVMGTEDISVRVIFNILTYTITGDIQYTGTPQYGQTITLTEPAAETGMRFAYFTVNGERIAGSMFEMPAENVTVAVVFEKIDYTITAANGVTYSGTPQYGQAITLTAGAAPEGKEFDYFTVNGERIDGNTFTMPAGDVQVGVVWKDAAGGCNAVLGGGMAIGAAVLTAAACAAIIGRKGKNRRKGAQN